MLLCFLQELEAGDQPLKEGLVVEEDQEGVEEEVAVEEQMIHLLVVVAVEEGQKVQMTNALVVVEGTSCWEEVGAPWHQGEMEVGVEVLLWELWKEEVAVPLGPWQGEEGAPSCGEVVVEVEGVLLCTVVVEVALK